ncbi:LysR family transcriptional regulator [Streptomyces libani]|uniref:LysR family transcriptional regulator n=1 Tax=Streptomyces nigrescens TaxID=1920 RepID=A0A640TH60_STRNI|nr:MULTISPECIES: LysR family transcriptional regulator [Streptomyces]WAT97418.1 LysR family transcriptional regulator [Streptomyces libani subsp. libani]WDT56838.1 LysR family transcriptional regulator [Streptomyces sp. G7(2002)]GFE22909.1 LysR family transcriptional regulator [Streptomyces libani subsp. libani]GGV91716.1 LysR family transcriptional regulator [Streptomyces libani subsp. libani]
MKLNLHRLWVFEQVVECGGFSAAARKLYMSQPSVSQHVHKLEVSLRTTLIDRSGPRLRLTAQGAVLLQYAQRFSSLAQETAAAIDQLSGAPSGRLVVGSTATYSSYLLLPMFGRFAELFPGVERQLRTGNTTEITRQLTDGEVRLAVLPGDRAGVSPHYRVEPLLEEQLLLVAHPGHPLAGHAVSPADLAQQRFLFREEGSATRRAQDDALALWGLPPSRCPGVTGNETLKQAAAAGLGIAVMPQRCVTPELRDGHLALLRPDPGLPACTIVLATARETSLSPAEQEFASLLRTKGDA